jgi:hypothetical protein
MMETRSTIWPARILPSRILQAIIAALAIGVGVAPLPVFAATPQLLGSFQDWDAYQVAEGAGRLCYAISSPKKFDRPQGLQRAAGYFMLTNKTQPQKRAEPSLIAGYALQPGQPVKILVGDQRFNMFSKDDGAWIKEPADERRFVEALKAGVSLVVQGMSSQGAPLVDQYSLRGLTAALTAIDQACR